jgi:GAF domain-containing protein
MEDRTRLAVQAVLDLAREATGMGAGYVAEFAGGEQVYRALTGDAASFAMAQDEGYPLDGSYCQRVVHGELPGVIPDTRADERVNTLAITELGDIGSYLGAPLELEDGTVFGTACLIGHDSRADLGERDVALLGHAGRAIAVLLDRAALVAERDELASRVAELERELSARPAVTPDLAAAVTL